MRRIRAALLLIALALGIVLFPQPARAAVGDTFTEPITIGGEEIPCTFKVTSNGTVSVGKGGFSARNSTTYYSVRTAEPALPTLPTSLDSSGSSYVLDAAGELVIPSTITHDGTTYTVTSIADGAFYSGAGVTSVTIPSTVTSIGAGAFCECTALTSVNVPSGVTTIPDYCFTGCTALRGVDGAEGVSSIGTSAFRSCNALRSVTVPPSVVTIGEYAYCDCSALVDVTMGNAVTSVGSYAFYGSHALESVTLSTALTALPDHLFAQCYNLSTLTNISQIASMGDSVFFGCANLRSFEIPAGLTTIPEDAFHGSGLTSVTIPASVGLVDDNAFVDCHNLRQVTFADGGSVALGFMSFARCTALETIDLSSVAELRPSFGMGSQFSGCTGLTSVELGSHITSVPDAAFNGCTALSSITFPSQVTSLDEEAFNGCTALNAVTIPATLTSLDYESFHSCYGMVALVLEGSTVKELGGPWNPTYDYQFAQGFCRIYVPDSLVSTYKADANWSPLADYILPMSQKPADTNIYALLKTDGTLVQCNASDTPISGGKTFVVSGNASGDYAKYAITSIKFQNGVTQVPLGAFAYCKALTSVSLPASVTSIGENAFYNCTALTQVSGSGVRTVAYRAFDACPALRSAGFLGSITALGRYAFRGCTALAEASLNPTLMEIGDGAFDGCANLSQVTLPTSASYLVIGAEAFRGCTALQGIELPEQIWKIGDQAFAGSGLTSASVPSSNYDIGHYVFDGCRQLASAHVRPFDGGVQAYMFNGCTALRSVTLDDGVDEIYSSAFSGCTALQQVDLSNVTKIDRYAFDDCSGLWEAVLPEGLYSLSAAFHNCTGLASAAIPGGTSSVSGASSGSYYYGAFSGCTGLSSVTFGEGYSADIGVNMFEGCTGLRSIQVPDAVTLVGEQAFANCSLLRDVHLPASLAKLDGDSFMLCVSLEEIDVPAAGTLEVQTFPTGGQFEGCTRLSRVSLPDGLVAIAPGMFYHCDSLTEVTIPASVGYVGDMAFRACGALETVIFENDCSACDFASEESYGPDYYVFGGCDALATVVFREKKPQEGAITFSSNPAIYYTVRYYPAEDLTGDRGNCVGQLTAKAGTNVLGASAPDTASIYDGEWVRASVAEPAITADNLSDSGWALPVEWRGVLFVTQPEGGDSPDGSFSLTAEARVREVSGGNATDLTADVSYAWYECDSAGNISGDPVGTGATLALTGLSEGPHRFVCVASSTAEGLDRPSVTSHVATVTVKSGRLSASPSPVTYRWPVSESMSGHGPSLTLTNTSGFTVHGIRWTAQNGYFSCGNEVGSDSLGSLEAGKSMTLTLHPHVPDAEPRDYQDTMIFTADNAIALEVPLVFTFFEVSGPYLDFSYGPNGTENRDTTVDFGTIPVGYSDPQGNYGMQCTLWAENGSVTLTQRSNPAHFTIYNENISRFPRTFANTGSGLKIAPKAGLAAGTYEDTLTYTYTANGKTKTLPITLRVKVKDAGGIEVSPTSCDWGSAQEGYGSLGARTVTVTNTGDQAVTLPANTGASLAAFTVSGAAGLSIPAGESRNFTVAPNADLAPGTYNETLQIAPAGVGAKTVSLSLTVTEAPRAYVYVVNETYLVTDGATWDESLLFGEPTVLSDSSMLSAIEAALDDIGSTYEEADGRITAIDGVANGSAGEGSAWRFYVNGEEVEGSLANVAVEALDELWCRYIAGEDAVGSCLLDALETEPGELSPAFGSETFAYETELPVGSKTLTLRVTPRDEGCPVVVKVDGAVVEPSADDASLYVVPVENGSRVTVTCGDEVDASFFDEKTYTIDVTVPGGPRWKRLAGNGRYDTMAEIVAEGFDQCDYAVVATGDNFPDALSASSLAGALRCPVVLTASKSLSAKARAQLTRLGVKKVYVMGGRYAVSDETVSQIVAIASVREVERVAGGDRQGTSLETMKKVAELTGQCKTIVVGTGFNFADALAVGPWCYTSKMPILLAGKNRLLSADQASAAKRAGVNRVIIVGGQAAVDKAGVLKQLGLGNNACELLAGPTRYDTADEIARFELENGMTLVHAAVATGANFPDALAGAALCGANNSVLLLASGTGSPAIKTLVRGGTQVELGYFLGGKLVVTPELATYVEKNT